MEPFGAGLTRRTFLVSAAAAGIAPAARAAGPPELSRKIGITTASVGAHLSAEASPGKFTLLELPRVMRDELGMTVIDLNTSTLASTEPAYLEKVRTASAKAGCVLTNLKMNQRDLDMASTDAAIRGRALAEYKRSIDHAALLGCRWARPLPREERPDRELYVASYREMADYAAEKNVQMLVENFGWMQDLPNAVPEIIRRVDRNLASSPDIGNWNSETLRYQGLEKAFPSAVSCDFKFRDLGPEGEHPDYDLERCFRIGWDAGFQGPWCFEHAQNDRTVLFRSLITMRDLLSGWMASA